MGVSVSLIQPPACKRENAYICSKMINLKRIAGKISLAKWFLNVTLLFSVLTFSGYAPATETPRQEKTRTEVLVTVAKKERTTPYKTVVRHFPRIIVFQSQIQTSLIAYSSILQAKTHSYLKEINAVKKPGVPHCLKYLPRNPDYYLSIPSVG